MEKNEKVREHIVIPEEYNTLLTEVVDIFLDMVKNILNDEMVTFAFANEQGLLVGSENIYPIENYIYDNGTLFRAFTQEGRWRLSAIRRRDSSSVTLIELLAPFHTADKIKEATDFIIEKTKGIRSLVL